MEIVEVEIGRVIPYARNPRKDGAVQKVAASLKEFGFKQPIVVDGEMTVIAGHTRLEAARLLGLERVPVLIARDLDPVKVKAYRIADNRVAEDAAWDADLLQLELLDLKAFEYDLPLLGFEDGELQAYVTGSGTGAREDEDDVPEPPAEPVTRPGDLWILDKHRLLCGDATVAVDVERLLGGTKPDMAWCDPPYGISVVSGGGTVGASKPFGSKSRKGQIGGEGGPSPFGGFKGGSRKKGPARPTGSIGGDQWIAAGKYFPIIGDDSTETAVKAAGVCAELAIPFVMLWGANNYADALLPSRCWVVWDKETTGNFSDVELAWTNKDAPARLFRHQWSGLMKASERGERRVHPTQKPIALPMWCFSEFGKAGDVVLDLFIGSAPSLMAAERTGRILLGMELSPNYIDVALQRWQNEAGMAAKLDGTGERFDDVAAARQVRAA
jgi:ParB-like chromosome segregation protein Spo0J